jgi:hypothetical protein
MKGLPFLDRPSGGDAESRPKAIGIPGVPRAAPGEPPAPYVTPDRKASRAENGLAFHLDDRDRSDKAPLVRTADTGTTGSLEERRPPPDTQTNRTLTPSTGARRARGPTLSRSRETLTGIGRGDNPMERREGRFPVNESGSHAQSVGWLSTVSSTFPATFDLRSR